MAASARTGQYVRQVGGYRAFVPAPLPPDPPIQGDPAMPALLSRADQAPDRRAAVFRCNPHRFRRMYAVRALREGTSPFEAQLILGHESLSMTRRYAKLAEHDVELASEPSSPFDGLKLGF